MSCQEGGPWRAVDPQLACCQTGKSRWQHRQTWRQISALHSLLTNFASSVGQALEVTGVLQLCRPRNRTCRLPEKWKQIMKRQARRCCM